MNHGRNLKGKQVTVHASGTVYRGTVVEMGEDTLVLRAAGGFREIPWDRVTRVTDEGAGDAGPSSHARGPLPKGWGG